MAVGDTIEQKQMTIIEKLMCIQNELKAPKNQHNKFGNYNYRSCEDILEGVKPLLYKYKTIITIADEIIQLGDRYYVKATAVIESAEITSEKIENIAYAREELAKKGMDASQITGSASSYARKYALNGLLLIDDTKDADSNEQKEQSNNKKATTSDGSYMAKDINELKRYEELIIKGLRYDVDFKGKHSKLLLDTAKTNTNDPGKLTPEGLEIINNAMEFLIGKKIKSDKEQ